MMDAAHTLRAADWLALFQRNAAAHAERRALEQASGIRDEDLLEGLRLLGVTRATLPALELAPAVLVGWSDGGMSRLERDRLRVLALRQGIDEQHEAWPLLQRWMLQRPGPHDEHVLLSGLAARLKRLPARVRARRRAAILQDCDAIARAAGPVLGGPKVSRDERHALASVAATLDGGGPETARALA